LEKQSKSFRQLALKNVSLAYDILR
jgi:hypothetical protein